METPPAADASLPVVMLIRTDADKTHLLSCMMYIWSSVCVCVCSFIFREHTHALCARARRRPTNPHQNVRESWMCVKDTSE